jgi:hypothetical protein
MYNLTPDVRALSARRINASSRVSGAVVVAMVTMIALLGRCRAVAAVIRRLV